MGFSVYSKIGEVMRNKEAKAIVYKYLRRGAYDFTEPRIQILKDISLYTFFSYPDHQHYLDVFQAMDKDLSSIE